MAVPEIKRVRMVVMGTSRGGFEDLEAVLQPLPKDFCAPILAVRHQPPDCGNAVVHTLGSRIQLKVCFAENGDLPVPGRVYLAPPDRHLTLDPDKKCRLTRQPPVLFSRPAVDPLFKSAARRVGPGLVAVVLTGANHDGAQGVKAVKSAGGRVIVQDPDSAQAREMPEAALASAHADHVVWLDQIGPFLWSLARQTG